MASKKVVITTILVLVALILAITAISLRVFGSDEVPTSAGEDQTGIGTGEVGVTILPPAVEDKLAEDSEGGQK